MNLINYKIKFISFFIDFKWAKIVSTTADCSTWKYATNRFGRTSNTITDIKGTFLFFFMYLVKVYCIYLCGCGINGGDMTVTQIYKYLWLFGL